jgi:hypothetical protein
MKTTRDAKAGSLERVVSCRSGERKCRICGVKSLGLGWPETDVCKDCHEQPTCRMCGKSEMPWNWPTPTLCAECAMPRIITRTGRKAHCIFGYTHEGLRLTYCGIRWDGRASQATTQKHCKHCTKELRKAGMSWRWYHSQDVEAANAPHEPHAKSL